MNRIEELREARGLTRRELADRIGVTVQTIGRLETGEMQLRQHYIDAIARAMECAPGDLLVSPIATSGQSEVEPADDPDGLPSIAETIGHRGLRLYRVLAESLADIGVRAGALIWVDETESAISARKAGDVLLVRLLTPGILILRQFLPPNLLTTNAFGPSNSTLKLDDRTIKSAIVGVLLLPRRDGSGLPKGSATDNR